MKVWSLRKSLSKRLLLYRPNYFSRPPLNKELFLRRLETFNKDQPQIPPQKLLVLVKDCIKSNRYLQSTSTNSNVKEDFLNISTSHSTKDLEIALYQLIVSHKHYVNDDIMRRYLLETPCPTDPAKVIELLSYNFESQITRKQLNLDILRIGINNFLKLNDYGNCFRLLEETLRSSTYLKYRYRQIFNHSLSFFASMASISIFEGFLLEMIPFSLIVIGNSLVTLGVMYGIVNLKYPNHLGRISWRKSNSLINSLIYSQELLLINRIISYFEEHNEINLKNYHYSQVRDFSQNVNKVNGYYVEGPESQELVRGNDINDHNTVSLQQYFRDEFRARKITINDLPEELHFMEFWLTQSEDFEWVEPDQDPAEINLLAPTLPQPSPIHRTP